MMCTNPLRVRNPKKEYVQGIDEPFITVPCGRCAACLSTKITDWSNRLRLAIEMNHGMAYFLTLTYSDDTCTYNVCKEDVQKFIKRLRHRLPPFTYYLVSEYGPTTFRPHYHIILVCDCEYETCMEEVEKAWQQGFIECTRCTEQRVTYMCNYHASKGNNVGGRSPTFVLMSKGIGKEYLTNEVERYYRSNPRNFLQLNGTRYHLPRYYRDKLYDDNMKEICKEDTIKSGVIDRPQNWRAIQHFEEWFEYNVKLKKNHKHKNI